MDTAASADIRKHIRIYLTIFAALAFLTVVTVAVSYLNVSTPVAVLIALVIASIKASLVASYFMHLISERKTIFGILIISAIFLIVMLLIPTISGSDMLLSDPIY